MPNPMVVHQPTTGVVLLFVNGTDETELVLDASSGVYDLTMAVAKMVTASGANGLMVRQALDLSPRKAWVEVEPVSMAVDPPPETSDPALWQAYLAELEVDAEVESFRRSIDAKDADLDGVSLLPQATLATSAEHELVAFDENGRQVVDRDLRFMVEPLIADLASVRRPPTHKGQRLMSRGRYLVECRASTGDGIKFVIEDVPDHPETIAFMTEGRQNRENHLHRAVKRSEYDAHRRKMSPMPSVGYDPAADLEMLTALLSERGVVVLPTGRTAHELTCGSTPTQLADAPPGIDVLVVGLGRPFESVWSLEFPHIGEPGDPSLLYPGTRLFDAEEERMPSGGILRVEYVTPGRWAAEGGNIERVGERTVVIRPTALMKRPFAVERPGSSPDRVQYPSLDVDLFTGIDRRDEQVNRRGGHEPLPRDDGPDLPGPSDPGRGPFDW